MAYKTLEEEKKKQGCGGDDQDLDIVTWVFVSGFLTRTQNVIPDKEPFFSLTWVFCLNRIMAEHNGWARLGFAETWLEVGGEDEVGEDVVDGG